MSHTPPVRVRTRRGLFFDGSASSPAERAAGKRQLKKGQILNLLLRQGDLSRVEIARTLGFNLRTVSLLVESLIAETLVIEKESPPTANGRRPIPVALNPVAASVLGIDAGRSRTTLALMDLEGRVLHRREIASTFDSAPGKQLEWVIGLVADFLREHGRSAPPLAGIGFAPEGFVYQQNSPQRYSEIVEPIRGGLESAIGIPVLADTDSRLLALGEQWFGAARAAKNAVIFNISDGLGLGCIADGKLLYGSHGWAGEIGHLPLGEPGIPCFCGSSGCLENTVSGMGLVRMAASKELVNPGDPVALEKLVALALDGSKPARKVFERFAIGLAQAVTIAVDMLNPRIAVVGGRVARYAPAFMDQFTHRFESQGVPFIMRETTIRTSEQCENSVLLGACALILNQIYNSSHVPMEALL